MCQVCETVKKQSPEEGLKTIAAAMKQPRADKAHLSDVIDLLLLEPKLAVEDQEMAEFWERSHRGE